MRSEALFAFAAAVAFGAALTWQAVSLGEAPQARTEAPALGIPLRSPAAGADGLGLVYQPPALYPTVAPSPTPEPTLSAPTAVVAAASAPPIQYNVGGDVEQWRSLVASIFPAFAVETVLRIMRCESGGNPLATGSAGERGLMQIHPLHFDSDYDPRLNLLAAFRISGGGTSWGAWSCKP